MSDSERLGALESRVADWEQILNRSHESMRGEEIKTHAALERLTEEFKATRQEIVNLRGEVRSVLKLVPIPKKRRRIQ